MVKKIGILLVAIIMLLPVGLFSQAAETPTFSITNASGYAGDEVMVEIQCSGNPGITAWQMQISYDKTNLELKSFDNKGSVFEGNIDRSKEISDMPYSMLWSNGLEDLAANGKVATLTFKISNKAPAGDYIINIDSFKATKTDISHPTFTLQNGTITVEEKEPSSITSSNTSSKDTSSAVSSNTSSKNTSSAVSSNTSSKNTSSATSSSSSNSSSSSSSSSSSTGGTNNNNNNKNGGTVTNNNNVTPTQNGKNITTGDIGRTTIALSVFILCLAGITALVFKKKADNE